VKRKSILITSGVIMLTLIAITIGGFWYMSVQPLYKPGMVRAGKNLNAPLLPPTQPDGNGKWLVEPGIELAHFAVGKGRNVLVIHGGPGMPFIQPMSGLEPLTDQFRFHYYDQRGSGESTRPIDRFTSPNMYQNMQELDKTLGLGAQIADIERIRKILGDEKLILIGHSWGGLLASLYAAEFPEHVEALILVSPANILVMPQPRGEDDLFASVRAGLPPSQQTEFDAFMKEYMNFNTLFQKSENDLVAMNIQFGEYYQQVVHGSMQVPGKPGGWMVWAMYISMGQQHDYRPVLTGVHVPVLVIHGRNDLQNEAATRLYADTFPNARLVTLDNAAHFSFEDQPAQFADIVGTFLENHK